MRGSWVARLGETYFEEGGELCPRQNECLQWACQALDMLWKGSLRLKGMHTVSY
jgi:hypothetical protein